MPNNPPKKTNRTTLLILLAIAALALLLVYFFPALLGNGLWETPPGAANADFAVHFIDVGQGDCTLISADGRHMLIDGGERGNEDRVVKYLKNQGVRRLDIVIATHPHSDHMGGLAYGIMEAFPVGTVIAPRFSAENTPTTRTYERFLQVVGRLKQKGTAANFARPGTEYMLGQATCTILGPLKEDGRNYNNDSVIVRVAYGNVAVLLTGDAERGVEGQLVKHWGADLRATLLSAGHHGSKTSSTKAFLDAAGPQVIAISSGSDNTYGHPHADVLQRCRDMGVMIYRTDTEGTVVFGSDGRNFWRIEN